MDTETLYIRQCGKLAGLRIADATIVTPARGDDDTRAMLTEWFRGISVKEITCELEVEPRIYRVIWNCVQDAQEKANG